MDKSVIETCVNLLEEKIAVMQDQISIQKNWEWGSTEYITELEGKINFHRYCIETLQEEDDGADV
jgi:hypothetical protein